MFIRFVIFFCAAVLFTSCCNDVDLKLSPAVRSWAPYYNLQRITFQNQNGDTISFKAYIKNYNQQGNDKVCGDYNIETLETTLVAQADTNVQIKVNLSFEALVDIKALNKSHQNVNLNIQFNSVSEQYISNPFRGRYYKELEVNGKIYHQVLHAYGIHIGGSLLAEIYYAKDNGLVGFRDFSGTWFYLQ